jgi:16S rRNA (cytidine1402-2'-O)-methyltransferase
LRELAVACGSDRPGAVCRELTKLHEAIVRGSLGELAAAAGPEGKIPPRGEFAIVVGAWPGAGRPAEIGDVERLAAGRAEVNELVAAGLARGDAARRVAAATGLPRRRLYGHDEAAAIEASQSDEKRA